MFEDKKKLSQTQKRKGLAAKCILGVILVEQFSFKKKTKNVGRRVENTQLHQL